MSIGSGICNKSTRSVGLIGQRLLVCNIIALSGVLRLI